MAQGNRDTKDGTIGFSSQLAGNAKAGKTNTTGFGPQKPTAVKPTAGKAGGLEEGGRHKHPNTSAVARILPQHKQDGE